MKLKPNFVPTLVWFSILSFANELSSSDNNSRSNLVERIVTYEQVELVWGKVGFPSTHRPNYYNKTGGDLDVRAVLTSNSVLDVLLNKRLTCQLGYGLCASFSRCCPSSGKCCTYGYCLQTTQRCCPTGPCDLATKYCCGQSHCSPIGGDCCKDESSCEPGNKCFILTSQGNRPVCCTDSTCTAHVQNGLTTYATSTTTTRTYTSTSSLPQSTEGPVQTTLRNNSPTQTGSDGHATSTGSSGSSSTGDDGGGSGRGRSTNIGAIVGGTVGGIAAIAIGILAVFFIIRNKKKNKQGLQGAFTQPPGPIQSDYVQTQPPLVQQHAFPQQQTQPYQQYPPYGPQHGYEKNMAVGHNTESWYGSGNPTSLTTASDLRTASATPPPAWTSSHGSPPPPNDLASPRSASQIIYEAPGQTHDDHRGQMHELS